MRIAAVVGQFAASRPCSGVSDAGASFPGLSHPQARRAPWPQGLCPCSSGVRAQVVSFAAGVDLGDSGLAFANRPAAAAA